MGSTKIPLPHLLPETPLLLQAVIPTLQPCSSYSFIIQSCETLWSSELPKHHSDPYHSPFQITLTFRGSLQPPEFSSSSLARQCLLHLGPLLRQTKCLSRPLSLMLFLCLGCLVLNSSGTNTYSSLRTPSNARPHGATPNSLSSRDAGHSLPAGSLLTLYSPHQRCFLFLFCTRLLVNSLVFSPHAPPEPLKGRKCIPEPGLEQGRVPSQSLRDHL